MATKKMPAVASKDIGVAIVGGRKAVEAFVQQLPPDDVLPFLALAMPVKKDFEYGVKLAEARVVGEALTKTREWTHPTTGVIYEWGGAMGDLFVADPAALRADLEMEDVEKSELDQALYQEWKVNFTNLKNIENTALRTLDSSRANEAERDRARRIVGLIHSHRDRKKDGPPHLKESEA